MIYKPIPYIPSITTLLIYFQNPLLMKDLNLEHFETFRKANTCVCLFELLARELGFDPLNPSTTWAEIAKSYSITMEDARQLQSKSTENETVTN